MVKIPLISPLLFNGKFVSDFLEKANIFNYFFSQQYQPMPNDRILPLMPCYYKYNRLNIINFNYGKISKVMPYLDPNKAHGSKDWM